MTIAKRIAHIRFRKFKQVAASIPAIQNTVEVALRKKLTLAIEYTDSNGSTTNRAIEPLFIDQSGNIRAWDNREQNYRSFKPGRIKQAYWDGQLFETKGRNIPALTKNYREVV